MTNSGQDQDSTKRSAYERKLAAGLEETRARVEVLRAQMKGAAADAEIEVSAQFQRIDEQLSAYTQRAERALEDVMAASEESWSELSKQADEAWENITGALKKAVERIAETKPPTN